MQDAHGAAPAVAPNFEWAKLFASLGFAHIRVGATSVPRHRRRGCAHADARARARGCTLLRALPARKRLQPLSPHACLPYAARPPLSLGALRARVRTRTGSAPDRTRHPFARGLHRFGRVRRRRRSAHVLDDSARRAHRAVARRLGLRVSDVAQHRTRFAALVRQQCRTALPSGTDPTAAALPTLALPTAADCCTQPLHCLCSA